MCIRDSTIHAQHDIIETLSSTIDVDKWLADLLLDEIIGDEVIEKDIGESSEIFDRHIDIELHAFEDILQFIAEADELEMCIRDRLMCWWASMFMGLVD